MGPNGVCHFVALTIICEKISRINDCIAIYHMHSTHSHNSLITGNQFPLPGVFECSKFYIITKFRNNKLHSLFHHQEKQ